MACKSSSLLPACVLLLLIPAQHLSAQWQNFAHFDRQVSDVYFMPGDCDARTGFVGTEGWALYRTSDGGRTWKSVAAASGFSNLHVIGITFKDAMTGWFTLSENTLSSTRSDAIYKTTDGGKTWTSLGVQGDFPAIYRDSVTGRLLVSSWTGPNKTSTDGGATWQNFDLPQHCGFAFVDPMNGILTAVEHYPLLTTSDGGASWQSTTFLNEAFQPFAQPCSRTLLLASESRNAIFRSMDLGHTWSQIAANPAWQMSGDLVGDANHLFIQGLNGVFESTDQGVTWNSIGGPVHGFDERMFVRFNKLYAADQVGNLLTYTFAAPSPTLAFSPDALRFRSNSCLPLRLAAISPCAECSLPLTIDSIRLSDSSRYHIEGPSTNVTVGAADSIVLARVSDRELDSTLLHFYYRRNGVPVDTVIALLGAGTLRDELTLDSVRVHLASAQCASSEAFVRIGAVNSLCSDSIMLVSASVTGPASFTLQLPTLPATVAALDSLRIVRAQDTSIADTAYVHLRFALAGLQIDTTIEVLGSRIDPVNEQLTLDLAGTPATRVSLAPGATSDVEIRAKYAMKGFVGWQSTAFDLYFGGSVVSVASVTPASGWSIASRSDHRDRVTLELTHLPYDLAAGELLATVRLRAAVGASDSDLIALQNVRFNPEDPAFQQCAVLALPSTDSLVLAGSLGAECGDSVIHSYLRGEPLFRIVSVRPNPSESLGSVTVWLNSRSARTVGLRVHSLLGTVLVSETVEVPEGDSELELPVQHLPAGTYVLEIETEGSRVSRTLVITR